MSFLLPKLQDALNAVAPSLFGRCSLRHAGASRRASSALLAVVVAMLLAGTTAGAEPETYALDPVHTRVMLAVDHAGFSKAIGTVSGSTGMLRFDPDDWTTATVRAEVPLTRIDFGDAKWNEVVLDHNLLDADDHPLATFVSTRIEPVDAQHAAVYGDLTLRGVTREVKLDVTLNARKRRPLPPFRRTVGFSATTDLSRADFGIDAWKSVIGDRVELRIEAEATRTRAGDAGESGAPEHPVQPPPAQDQPPPETMPEPAAEPIIEPPTDPAEVPLEDPASGATQPDPEAAAKTMP